ncbi:MAG: 16S rRNA (adenine(1518)-N(6)/adenine(1519)-N(6))-dimethyltransferase RsmA [Oscillospiraceae bacterium]|nr:16S rRNA (adenine(1518)-N(6)/adenine(1519)-N(6))-dimethyltransferase RsmA [Oscillospiraceae bacterium]
MFPENAGQMRELLSRHGFRFSKSKGQNFLITSLIPERMVALTGTDAQTGVLEVGPGIGCLTRVLSRSADKVVAVEIDRSLEPILAETLTGLNNVELIFGDILKTDIKELVSRAFNGLRPAVCANLPYNITSPLLTKILESGLFEEITVMIQSETARRLCAAPGTPEYGAFTVFVNWHAETEMLFDVSPECFIPKPEVSGSVIRLLPRKSPPRAVVSEKMFFRTVRSAFGQRRKTLRNALAAGFPECLKADIELAIRSCGIAPDARGETLGIPEFAELSDRMSDAAGSARGET